jgi:hypothetical protein
MADGKKSFILYCDQRGIFNKLSDEQAGVLIKHIFAYVSDENPQADFVTELAFELIKQQLKRDLKTWEVKQEQRREAGKRSAEQRQRNATTVEIRSTETNDRSVSSTVNGNGNVNGNVNGNGNVNEKKRKEGVTAPPPHPLIAWIVKNAPRVQQLKQPLTNDEAQRIMDDLAIDSENKKQRLRDLLISMENYKPLLTKSVSANLTIRKWWKSELERTGEVAKATVTPIKMNTETYSR